VTAGASNSAHKIRPKPPSATQTRAYYASIHKAVQYEKIVGQYRSQIWTRDHATCRP